MQLLFFYRGIMNTGKIFEEQIKKSVPYYCFCHRVKDGTGIYSHETLCDFLIFNNETQRLFCVECKSTKGKSISFENINEDNPKKAMIHKHQILGLKGMTVYNNIISGFLINFRDDKLKEEKCYFIGINNFLEAINKINKKSLSATDLMKYNAMEIPCIKLRKRYRYDLSQLLYL